MPDSDAHTHNLLLSDRTQKQLTNGQAMDLELAMVEGKQFWRMDRNTIYNISRDIIRIEPLKRTQADRAPAAKQLPEGQRTIDKNGPGYQSFLKAKRDLIAKMSLREGKKV